ncbi:MAG: tagaturonate epimerase family protein [Melioribacteraceae bacterium]|nr:tagaturonate epimerase family protein [Melioribacteraceae bacterium]
MKLEDLSKFFSINEQAKDNDLKELNISASFKPMVYPKSIIEKDGAYLFIGKSEYNKYLCVVSYASETGIFNDLNGELVGIDIENYSLKKCELNHQNAAIIQEYFSFTKPELTGINNSFGFGDRIGLANAAHIRSLENSNFKPILAQQSIRELTRTQRTPDEVMDAAVWAVLQEGYKDGFGADADHLKTFEDIDLMINAGFTFFTLDPSEFVNNDADSLNISELEKETEKLRWKDLKETRENMLNRYGDREFDLGEGLLIKPDYEQSLRAAVKYANVIAHVKSMSDYLNNNYADRPYEIEISVDETESVTTPFEHFFMASEMSRLGIKFISLAPRFIGDFEKGIDYKGDIEVFKKEYFKHVKISEFFGSYKISLHSGSDKFDVYKAIGQLKRGYTHVKTAGTSYLEALRVVAKVNPNLFRKILDFSRIEFEKEKETYHVSADLKNVNESVNYFNEQLVELFTQNDARQVLHVTFGKVLTELKQNGKFLFKDEIIKCLKENEELHNDFIINHFKNHLKPFN